MVNIKTDPDIYIKIVEGYTSYEADDKALYLRRGVWPNPSGRALIYNKSKDKYLTFNIYTQDPNNLDIRGRQKKEGKKVSPGKSVRVTAPADLLASDYYLGDFDWRTEDPAPGDPGGKSDQQRQWDEVVDWLIKYGPWLVAAGVGVFLLVMFIKVKYGQRAPVPAVAPVVAPAPAPAPVVVEVK